MSAGEDLDGLISKHAVAEDGNDAGFAVGILSGAVDIGVAEDRVIECVFAAGGFKIFFDGKFAAGVGAEGDRCCMNSGASAFRDFAVDGTTGACEDKVFDTDFGAAMEDVEGADNVDGGVSLGFANTH